MAAWGLDALGKGPLWLVKEGAEGDFPDLPLSAEGPALSKV